MRPPSPLIDVRALPWPPSEPRGEQALLDLRVLPGEFVCLVGPTGADTSALLRVLAGLAPLPGGQLTHAPEATPSAWIYPRSSLLPWRTVEANVALPLELRGESPTHRREVVMALLGRLGLAEHRAERAHALPPAAALKVCLARAMVTQPQLVFADDPFRELPGPEAAALLHLLGELQRERGLACVLATRDVPEAVWVSTRVLVVGGGKEGQVSEIPIPLPSQRPAALRRDPSYLAYVAQVAGTLAGGQGAEA